MRSRDHCCLGKATSVKYYVVCVCSLDLVVRHANPICGLSGSTIFFPQYLTNRTKFGKMLMHKKWAFWFSLQHLSQNFLILRGIRLSQWPRGLRRRSAAACLLRLWVRRGHGCLYLVSVVCCHEEVSATSWSLVQRSPSDCGASLCVI